MQNSSLIRAWKTKERKKKEKKTETSPVRVGGLTEQPRHADRNLSGSNDCEGGGEAIDGADFSPSMKDVSGFPLN